MSTNWDFDAAQRLGQLWMDLFTRALTPDGNAAAAGSEGSGSPKRSTNDVTREMRSVTFNAMAKQADRLMRSPDFLEAMKQTMDASLEMQRRAREWLTQVRHQTEGVAVKDVDSLMVLLRHIETRALDRMDVLSEQLARIEGRLDALERASAGSGTSPPARRARDEADPKAAASGNGGGGHAATQAGGER